mmetsp:Transcript_5473/g.8534  ORF Transcript_5473/g.8534 Transcript_5473/m.8534 type:complete len:147 (+) Transcript_5473:754-1194(+)
MRDRLEDGRKHREETLKRNDDLKKETETRERRIEVLETKHKKKHHNHHSENESKSKEELEAERKKAAEEEEKRLKEEKKQIEEDKDKVIQQQARLNYSNFDSFHQNKTAKSAVKVEAASKVKAASPGGNATKKAEKAEGGEYEKFL